MTPGDVGGFGGGGGGGGIIAQSSVSTDEILHDEDGNGMRFEDGSTLMTEAGGRVEDEGVV